MAYILQVRSFPAKKKRKRITFQNTFPSIWREKSEVEPNSCYYAWFKEIRSSSKRERLGFIVSTLKIVVKRKPKPGKASLGVAPYTIAKLCRWHLVGEDLSLRISLHHHHFHPRYSFTLEVRVAQPLVWMSLGDRSHWNRLKQSCQHGSSHRLVIIKYNWSQYNFLFKHLWARKWLAQAGWWQTLMWRGAL